MGRDRIGDREPRAKDRGPAGPGAPGSDTTLPCGGEARGRPHPGESGGRICGAQLPPSGSIGPRELLELLPGSLVAEDQEVSIQLRENALKLGPGLGRQGDDEKAGSPG